MHADFHNADVQGGGGGMRYPARVSKLRVLELSRKKHRTSPDEYSRLVVRSFRPRSIFDPVMRGQRSNLRNIDNFSTYITITKKNYKS